GWLEGDELRQAFAAASVVATPAVYPDPFNLMNIEAMAHRRPVVATCYGGAPEIVRDGETGFVVDPWDVATFGNRLATLLRDRGLAEAMGEAGRQRVLAHFTLDCQVRAYLALYRGQSVPQHRRADSDGAIAPTVRSGRRSGIVGCPPGAAYGDTLCR
ncbi:MAG: hypothetical protein CL878_07305, partial [Dehalococcoidia bacterium]|nr:hypothetical protein [Dehalococcoidia bacterium]